MRILYLIHQFFPEYPTGTERFTLDLAMAMQRAGHSVSVLAWSNGKFPFTREQDGILLRDYSYQGLPVTAFRHKEYRPYEDFHIQDDPSLRRLAEGLLIPGRYDLVHVSHLMRTSPFVFAAIENNIPYVATLTDYFTLCYHSTLRNLSQELCSGPEHGDTCVKNCLLPWMKEGYLSQRISNAGMILSRAAAVTAPSQYLAQAVREEFPGLKIRIIRYGISLGGWPLKNRRYSDRSPITFGYLGALVPNKGVHLLIKAFRKIRNPKCRLRIYGVTNGEQYWLDLLALAHGDRRITFCGPYESRPQLNKILEALDATCVPSIWPDNYPLVIMEAQARKLPVIASRIGAIPEAIQDGVNGFLVKPDDSQSLYQSMQRLIDNPQALNGIRRINPAVRTVEEEAIEYESLYHAAINYPSRLEAAAIR